MEKNRLLTYADYQASPDVFTMEELIHIHELFVQSASVPTDEDDFAEKLYDDVIKKAKTYALDYRYPWFMEMSQSKRNDTDSVRTAAHNKFIASLGYLAAFQKEKGISTQWHELLGDPSIYRKRIGDFACYLIFIAAVNGR